MMITRHHTLLAGLLKQSPSCGNEETYNEFSFETDENVHAKTTVELHTEYTYDNCDVMNAGTMRSPTL